MSQAVQAVCGEVNETVLDGNQERKPPPTSLCGIDCSNAVYTLLCRRQVAPTINTTLQYWSLIQHSTKYRRWELIPQIVWVRWDNREDGDKRLDGIREWRIRQNSIQHCVPPGCWPWIGTAQSWLVFESESNQIFFKSNPSELLFVCLLAPTGALIVLMVYYSIYIGPQPLFEISSISANIFSFSFWELNADW